MIYFLYCVLLLLTIYTDSPLALLMGDFGSSLLPAISIPIHTLLLLSRKNKESDVFIKKFSLLVKYTSIISILFLFIPLILDISYTQIGEFIPIKTFKVFMFFWGFISFLKVFNYLQKNMSLEKIFKPYFVIFILISILTYLESTQIPHAFPFLHFTGPMPYYRIRLLTMESSHTAGIIVVFFAMSLYYTICIRKNKKQTMLIVILFIYQIMMTGSKTLILDILLAFVIINWQSIKNLKRKNIPYIVIFIISGGFFLYYQILPSFLSNINNDIEEYTSFITRTYSILIGYGIGILIPMGTGFGFYIYLFPTSLRYFFNYIPSIYNTTEIELYMNSDSDTANTAKSALAQYSMYWGILGTIYLVKILLNLLKDSTKQLNRNEKLILTSLFWIILFHLFTSSNFNYYYLSFYSVLIYLKRRNIVY